MAISRFQSRFKTRTDLMDNITPNNVVQMNASVPHGEWKPASWLPVVWQNEKSKDYFTISSGKVVSLDASGRVVPSGILRRAKDAAVADGSDVILTYTQLCVDARVIDVTTGEFVTAAKNVTLTQLVDGIISHGWLPQDTSTADLAAKQAAVEAFISAPVGIAAYDVYVWAGDDPANLHFTNYQKQHMIQFFTDIQMKVAHVCESAASTVTFADLDADNDGAADGGLLNATALKALARYKGLELDDVVGYNLELGRLATPTSRTPLTIVGSWRERSDISLLAKAGDWYLDADAGILLFWEEGGDAAPVDAAAAALPASITVFEYSDAASAQERMVMMVGDCRPGDFVSFDEMSNFVVADADDHTDQLVVGRMLALYKEPRGLLERVKTGFSGSEFDATAQMPGSATKGFSDLITLSAHNEESVADEIAVINVKIQ